MRGWNWKQWTLFIVTSLLLGALGPRYLKGDYSGTEQAAVEGVFIVLFLVWYGCGMYEVARKHCGKDRGK